MKKSTAVIALLLAMSSITMSAARADVIFYFTKTGFYNGNTAITDPNTFASATFKTLSANNVTLKMSVLPGLDTHGYVNDWAFNVDTSITGLTRTFLSGAEAKTTEFGNNIVNNFGGANGGDFDLAFHFDPKNPGQLAVNGTSTYTLTATNLTENSFSFINAKGIYSAVKVQGYGDDFSSEYKSGDPTDNPLPPTSIPEPTTVALLGLGLLGFAVSRRTPAKSRNV
jgi:type V secretory pathway adhesin AidA